MKIFSCFYTGHETENMVVLTVLVWALLNAICPDVTILIGCKTPSYLLVMLCSYFHTVVFM